jgi:hypothetical protein
MSSDSLYNVPSSSWDMASVSKMGPTIIMGSAKPQGSKAKPASPIRAAQSNHSEGRSDTKGGQQLAYPEPHRWDSTSSSFVSESQLGGFLHALFVGWLRAIRVFSPGNTQERCVKPSGPDLTRGGIGPHLVLWRGTCPIWLSPMNSDPGSIQILTQHYDAQS